MEEEMAAGTQELRHLHQNTTQLYYILTGRAVVEVGGSTVAARAGQAVEIGSGDPHRITNEDDAALRFLVISSGPPRDDRQDLQSTDLRGSQFNGMFNSCSRPERHRGPEPG
jgi:mannose-6-phosphate isomerase-like protein (cupin superfamily)